MARTVAELPPGARITDYISLGVITKTFPDSVIGSVLARTGKASVRQRDLPAQVVVYYVIALALYMQVLLSRGLALSSGRSAVAPRSIGRGTGGGQVGHLAGSHAVKLGACAAVTRRVGKADRGAKYTGGMVSNLAAGKRGWQHVRCGR